MMVVRGEVEKQIFINEISVVIIQSTAVSMTAALLNELIKNNVDVIFCDEKCNPSSQLLPYYGAHNTPKRYGLQVSWQKEIKDDVWQILIMRKILEQARLLDFIGKAAESNMLIAYAEQVEKGDVTNREGHAAKVYFNALNDGCAGRRDDNFFNGCLNYGYAVLLSAFNREIVASGYLTQLGIWHCNEFNQFNLGSDLMEPFRPFVDRLALSLSENEKFKLKMVDLLNYHVVINGKRTTFDLAIRQYTKSVIEALNSGETDGINFISEVEWKDEF